VQLLVNLLMNASEAIPAGDAEANVISVSARAQPDGRVRIEVEDTGRGIAPADAVRVFEPFWTAKTTGMGLGLAICLGIVSSLRGEIFVDSERAANARGARFVVILPTGEARLSSPASTAVTPPPAIAGPLRGRVLIVDDEQRLAEALRLALSADHDVQVATRGKRALEILLADPSFDVVLCDLLLPDLNGADLFEEVAARFPELAKRFIFLTGGAFSARTRDFLQGVANARLEKPFDLVTLERLVNEQVVLGRSST
jgi:CheY-like chemotaxis protein